MALRTFGRIGQTNGVGGKWVEVTTDANGLDDAVWTTTLIQCLKLSQGESPFYSSYGIPARYSVVTQVFPDYGAATTQTQFSPYFASLAITRIQGYTVNGIPTPAYQVNAVCHNGATVGVVVASGQTVLPE